MTRPMESPLRKEGRDKLTGRAQYVDDLHLPGMIYGVTVRSSIPHGRIRNIHFEDGIPWSEFTIVTHRDIPGENIVALIVDDQPCLVENVIQHSEEPIILLAHPDRWLLEKARTRIRIETDPLPAILTLDEAIQAGKILKSFHIEKGKVDSVWTQAHRIIEGTYETGAQEQLYIENNGVIAVANSNGVTVWGSMQCPYYIHKALVRIMKQPDHRVRVIQTVTGGGFGGKEEYPSILSGHAALLALKSGKPVKMVYDRTEDMAATTKRHPSRTWHRTALDRNGKFLGMDIRFEIDGGAYATLSQVVLSRGTIHAAGPYLCPHIRIESHAYFTHTPPHGAFRGFGAPQSVFALERHIDRIAKGMQIDPIQIRRTNFIKKGDVTSTGGAIRQDVDMNTILDQALKESDYLEKRTRYRQENGSGPVRRGIGVATFLHGAGFTGSGEKYLASVLDVRATSEGRVQVLSSSTEIGQGTNTIFSQIAADTLGIDYSDIDVVQPDTHEVPNSGPTVASRTAMIVGKLVENASAGLKQVLIQSGFLRSENYSRDEFKQACAKYTEKFGELRSSAQYNQPRGLEWDDEKYSGDAYGAYAWAAYVADVSVDTVTYETTINDFVAVQEVGKVIHPILASGQIEGGVAQGIGYALYEKVIWRDGRMANGQMTNYIMPTAADVPPIRVFFQETPYEGGPGGAKGIGELPMDGPGPAILNAIADATDIQITRLPLLPEDLLNAVRSNP